MKNIPRDNPHNIKSHLTYSLHRLNLDYVDLYEPARMDLAYPIEEIVVEISKLVETGYVKNIGLTQIDEETLKRANKIHKIHTVELRYSLTEREYEKTGLIETAKNLGVNVLQLALAWNFAKFPYTQSLIGTTSAEHLQESIDALKIELIVDDVAEIESVFPEEKVSGRGMPEFICRNGKLIK